jgi:hypothetical protein
VRRPVAAFDGAIHRPAPPAAGAVANARPLSCGQERFPGQVEDLSNDSRNTGGFAVPDNLAAAFMRPGM